MALKPLAVRLAAVTLVLLAACSDQTPAHVPNERPSIRLSPEGLETTAEASLVDRDTTGVYRLNERKVITLRFGHPVELRRLKVHGARDVRLEVEGLEELATPSPEGWASADLREPLAAQALKVALVPTGPDAQLSELEVWGAGRPLAPRELQALRGALDVVPNAFAPSSTPGFEDLRVHAAEPEAATLAPAGTAELDRCARVRLPAFDPHQAQRAYLTYEANVARAVSLQVSLNGELPRAGFWLGTTPDSRLLFDELDPERLHGGDVVTLCLPEDAGATVHLRKIRLALLLDNGVAPFDRDSSMRLGAALDGDEATTQAVPRGENLVSLERAFEVDQAELQLGRAPARLEQVATFDGTAWQERGGVELQTQRELLPVSGRLSALRLVFAGAPREDAPAASVAEVRVAGSGVGPRSGAARLVLSYPSVTLRNARHIVERFGSRAFVAGWAGSPSGPGEVEVDGVRVGTDGAFATLVRRPAGTSADSGWTVRLRARFPDGTELTRELAVEEDRTADLLAGAADGRLSGGSTEARFGRENQTGWGRVDADKGGKAALGTDVLFEAPAGAVGTTTHVSITRKGREEVPRLDAGMVNVTAPAHSGYRFLPHGQKFARAARVTLPFDPALLPEGVAPEAIQTFYFDETQDRWLALPRREVRRGSQQIVSETTHFTFMINAVLVLPEHPGPASFNPNSIKDLKAADPSEGIDLIEPPTANNQGTARVSFPLRLPRARGAHQPSLSLGYDSALPSGWVGVGWDLSVPSISIDTRYGVPEYTGEERYLLSGEALVPVEPVKYEHGTTCSDNSAGRPYVARVEREFRKVLRCGVDPTSYWFEVTDKGGTLHVYGHSDTARLTSYIPRVTIPAASPAIYDVAQWFLERVIDANGNLTEYGYQSDSRPAGDAVHKEDFRQVYLRTLRYSGTAVRSGPGALSGGDPGPYLVEFFHEADERPDVLSSARNGFKSVTRRRLGRVEISLLKGEPSGRVRAYTLGYEPGDLGKSRLKSVTVHGTDDRVFYSHTFHYESHAPDADGVTLFGAPIPWNSDADKDSGLSGGKDWSAGFHGFVGLGLGPHKSAGAVGVGFGFSHRESETEVSFLDLNGDGLPDRVYGAGNDSRVLFNHGQKDGLRDAAPAWDPAGDPAARTDVALRLGERNLGKEAGNSFDVSLQVFGGPVALNFGASYSQSKSNDLVLDANGDGLVDLVNGGRVYFNQPRANSCPVGSTPEQCCRASGFCFLPSLPMPALESLGDSAGLAENDPNLIGANKAMDEALTAQDAVLEWSVPYDGTVDVAGALAFRQPPLTGTGRDGVRLRIYRYSPLGTAAPALLAEYLKPPSDTRTTQVSVKTLEVARGDLLYFVLSTLLDSPLRDASGALSPVEAVRFAPTVTYQGLSAAELEWRDPTGAHVYRFDAAADFALAGHPQGAAQVQRPGRMAFDLQMKKGATSDGVRVCIQAYAPDALPKTPQPCRSTDWYYREYGAAELASGALEVSAERAVHAGDTFFVRIDTDLPVDPRAVTWNVTGRMTCVDAGGACRTPTDDEARSLSVRAQPYFPLHDPVEPSSSKWLPNNIPARPFVAQGAGTLHVSSRAYGFQGAPIIFSVRTLDRALIKTVGDHGGADSGGNPLFTNVTTRLAEGEQVFFEAHSETASAFTPVCGPAGCVPRAWDVSCQFVRDDGVAESCTASQRATTDRHADGWDEGNSPLLAGGFHGWRYGAWNGRADEAFQGWVYRAPPKPDDNEWEGDPDEVRTRQKDRMKDENDPQRVRLRLLGLLVPSAVGTSRGSDEPGLEPDVASYVSQDGNTYFTAGVVHPGRKGESGSNQPRSPDGSVATPLAFGVGKIGRSSTSVTLSAGVSLPVIGGTVSSGMSQQKLDVMDMNGDRVLDVIAAGGVPDITDLDFAGLSGLLDGDVKTDVRVTSPVSLATGRVVRMPGVPQLNLDVGGQIGLGASEPIQMLLAKLGVRGVAGRLPSLSGGVGFNVGNTVQQLSDFNGDGLPDAVREGGTVCPGGFRVRLNLGTSFATAEDCVKTTGTFPSDPFVAKLGFGGDTRDADSNRGSEMASGIKGLGAVRRTTAVTIQGTAGQDLTELVQYLGMSIDSTESFGVSTSWESSLAATNLMLADVTGDGLPDQLYKANEGSDFWVRVNTGYGFARARKWKPAQAWRNEPDARRARFQVNGAGAVSSLLGAFVPNSAEGIDPLEANGTHSRVPSVGVAFTFSFPLLLGLPPYLHVGAGVNVSPQKVTGFELGLQDIDGDGLADHVLKTGNNRPVWVRLNQLGRANLLERIERPLGGTVSLAYEQRVGNTVKMPESRWVLTRVSANDGLGASVGHTLETSFSYEDGNSDRLEREFLGFAQVTRTNADGSRVIQRFRNDSVLTKGLLVSERTEDAARNPWLETVNTYAPTVSLRAAVASCVRATPILLAPSSYCGSFFTAVQSVEKRYYEGQPSAGIVTREHYGYDAFGNIDHFQYEGDLADSGDDLVSDVKFASDTAADALYSVARPESVLVKDDQGRTLRSRSARYDSKGNLEKFTAAISASQNAVSDFTWKPNGQLWTYEGPANDDGDRVKYTYGYDEEVTFSYVTSTVDHHGYLAEADYDFRFGQVKRTEDVNGQVIARDFDAFGRLWRIVGPYDRASTPTVSIAYAPDAPVPYAHTHNRLPRSEGDTRGTVDTVVAMDGLGRIVQTKKSAELAMAATTKRAGWTVSGHQVFDAMGRVAEQGQPFGDFEAGPEFVEDVPLNPTLFTYDVLGRMLHRRDADGSTTDAAYGFGAPVGTTIERFSTVTTDAEHNAKAEYRDPAGRVVALEERIKDRTPTAHYVYNALGDMTSAVDAAGNASTFGYDWLGRRTALYHPDSGLVSLTFDAAGSLRKKVDPNLRGKGEIIYTYDHELLTGIHYPTASRNVTYRYGTTPQDRTKNGLGRVVEVTDEVGSEERAYGKLGEVVETTRHLKPLRPGDRERSFTTAFVHDSFGRVLSVTYPDGEKLVYGYDAGGALEKATGFRPATRHTPAEQEVYLRDMSYDAFGQRVRVLLGNGVNSLHSYYPETHRLEKLTTTTPLGRTLQDITYTYDSVGNVRTMVNALGEPVGDESGEVQFDYHYDALYRLEWATGSARSRPGTLDRFTVTYKYSDIHNMELNDQLHEVLHGDGSEVSSSRPPHTNYTFDYKYEGAAPHQATRVGDTNLVYDASGNTLRECRDHGDPTCEANGDGLRRYVWTEESRLAQVIDGGGRNATRFFYGANGERVVKLGRGGESITIGQFWALKGRRAATKHVFAGSERIASKVMPPPGWDDVPRTVTLTGSVGEGLPNENGCDPSDYQPQKCPALPGGDPTVPVPYEDDAPVRPETYYYHPDHLGSTSWVTDQNARVHEHVEYFPYGGVWRDARSDSDGAPAKGQSFLFTAKELDEETGLYYFGARYYSPRTGRWLSPDPALAEYLPSADAAIGSKLPGEGGVFNPRNLNLYAYANLSPTQYKDADGRWSSKDLPGFQPVHQMAIANVLRTQVSPAQLAILQRQQVVIDEHQDPHEQHMHAMWDSSNKRGITQRSAIVASEAFVQDRLKTAIALRKSDPRAAMEALGDALHVVQDATSPSHVNFQDWGTQSHVGHVAAERKYPAAGTPERRNLEAATQWAFDVYQGKVAMPKQVFNPTTGGLMILTPPGPATER